MCGVQCVITLCSPAVPCISLGLGPLSWAAPACLVQGVGQEFLGDLMLWLPGHRKSNMGERGSVFRGRHWSSSLAEVNEGDRE